MLLNVLSLRLVFSFIHGEECTHRLVLLPLAKLAVTTAVPSILALGAPLRRQLATLTAFGVLHKFLKDFARVELHHAVHIFFGLLSVGAKEILHLVSRNLFPVATVDDARPQLW